MSAHNLGPAGRALLDAARGVEDPTSNERSALASSMMKRIGAGAFGASLTTAASAAKAIPTATAAASKVASGAVLKKALLGLVLVGAIGGGGAYGVREVQRARASHVAAVNVSAQATPPEAAIQAPAGNPLPANPVAMPVAPEPPQPVADTATPAARPERKPPLHVRSVPAGTRPARPDPQPTTGLDDELSLISRAQSALGAKDAPRALALADEHASKFPKGQLANEREQIRTLALCAMNMPEGRSRAEVFVRTNPGAPMAGRLRQACNLP
jgi:hypothetical protein